MLKQHAARKTACELIAGRRALWPRFKATVQPHILFRREHDALLHNAVHPASGGLCIIQRRREFRFQHNQLVTRPSHNPMDYNCIVMALSGSLKLSVRALPVAWRLLPPSTALTSKITLNHTPAMPGFFLVAIRYQDGGSRKGSGISESRVMLILT